MKLLSKRIISLSTVLVLLLSGCTETESLHKVETEVKDPFSVQYTGETDGVSTDDKTGEILYTPEYVISKRFKGVEEEDLYNKELKLKRSKDKLIKSYGKSVMGTTYDYAKEVIEKRGQSFDDYRVTSEETLENLAQVSFTDDNYLFNFCGVKLENSDKDKVTVYYTMQQIVGDAYEEDD